MTPSVRVRNLLAVLLAAIVLVLFFNYRTPQSAQPSATAEFGGVSLKIDYATTTAARELGLGGRTDIPGGYGMLFVFPKDGYYGFWMKDTLVPLDMFWLDAQGHVVFMQEDVATSTFPMSFIPVSLRAMSLRPPQASASPAPSRPARRFG